MDTTDEASASETPTEKEQEKRSRERCGNCGALRRGRYCHVCGQRHRDHPLRLRDVFRRVGRVFFELDRGLPYTAWLMLRRPGTVARRYLDGEARRFMGPVGYFLVTATLLFLVFGGLEDEILRITAEYQTEMRPWTGLEAKLAEAIGVGSRQELVQFAFRFQQNYFTYLELLAALPVATGLRLLFSQRTIAEWIVVELYTKAQIMVYTSMILPLLLVAGSRGLVIAISGVAGAVQLGVHVWAVCDFKNTSLGVAARAVGAYIFGSAVWGSLVMGFIWLVALLS